MYAFGKSTVLAATIAAALATSSAAHADPCGSVSNIGREYPLHVRNSSKNPIWFTIYKSQSRSGKTNYGCVKPGETMTYNNSAYSCGSVQYVLAEQKKGPDCNGGNLSEPMGNITMSGNDRSLIIWSNTVKDGALSYDNSKWK